MVQLAVTVKSRNSSNDGAVRGAVWAEGRAAGNGSLRWFRQEDERIENDIFLGWFC